MMSGLRGGGEVGILAVGGDDLRFPVALPLRALLLGEHGEAVHPARGPVHRVLLVDAEQRVVRAALGGTGNAGPRGGGCPDTRLREARAAGSPGLFYVPGGGVVVAHPVHRYRRAERACCVSGALMAKQLQITGAVCRTR